MITIDFQDREVLHYLSQLQRKLHDMTPVMDAIGMRLEEHISGRFETESDPSGAPWEPWVESTRKSYPKDGNRKLLDRYSDMLRSLSHQANKDSVRVGFGKPYAAYHEYGTKHMHRRGLLTENLVTGSLGREDRRAILDIVQGYLSFY